jgi:hypothetical protein
MRKVAVALLVILFLLTPTCFADLTFGYHIVQIGQVAILMQEGINAISDNLFYYVPDDMLIFYITKDRINISVDELYASALADVSVLNISDAEAENVRLDTLIGGSYLDITYKPNSTYDKLKGCITIHNGVMSAIMFGSYGAKDETEDEFKYKVRDYVYTLTFLE